MTSSRKILSPDLVEKARLELNEVQSEVPGQIQTLREKILENPNFNFRTDDAFLLRFLRARKFDQQRALELITNYYKQREYYPQFFSKSATSGLDAALNSKYQGVLFQRDTDGRAIVIIKSASLWDPKLFSFDDLLTNILLSLERIVEDEETQINGMVMIVNCEGFSMKQMLHISALAMKRAISLLVNSFPIRYKALHFINEPYILHAVFLVIYPFLSVKIRNRFVLHGSNFKSLHEKLSPDILPEEFGGHLGPYDNSAWNQVLIEHEQTMKKNLQLGFVRKK